MNKAQEKRVRELMRIYDYLSRPEVDSQVEKEAQQEYSKVKKLSKSLPDENPLAETFNYFLTTLLYAVDKKDLDKIADIKKKSSWVYLAEINNYLWEPLGAKNTNLSGDFLTAGRLALDPFRLRASYKKAKEVFGIPKLPLEVEKLGKYRLRTLVAKLILISFLDKEDIREIFKNSGLDPDYPYGIKEYIEKAIRYAAIKEAINPTGIIEAYLDTAKNFILNKLGHFTPPSSEMSAGFYGIKIAYTWYPRVPANGYLTFLSEMLSLAEENKEFKNSLLKNISFGLFYDRLPTTFNPSEVCDCQRAREAVLSLKKLISEHPENKEYLRDRAKHLLRNYYSLDDIFEFYIYAQIFPEVSMLINHISKKLKGDEKKKERAIFNFLMKTLDSPVQITPQQPKKKVKYVL